jgi:hypothetical protein
VTVTETIAYFDSIRNQWPGEWKRSAEYWYRRLKSEVKENAESFRARVEKFVLNLNLAAGHLARMAGLLGAYQGPDKAVYEANYKALVERHTLLASGLYAGAKPAPAQDKTGAGPLIVGLIIGAVVISIVGICWAVGQYQQSQALRDQAKVQAEELAARVEAMRTGQKLAESTLPKDASGSGGAGGDDSSKQWGGVILAAVAILGGISALPLFFPSKH